jgi:putative membrane protein
MKKTILTLAVALGCYFAQAQKDVSKEDKEFANEAYQASLMEIKLGELAPTHASSQEVKTLAQHMVTDHTKANTDLKALAGKRNIPMSYEMTDKTKEKVDKMAEKKGKDFDEAYSECMVKDHKDAIDLFEKEAKHGTDGDVSRWASNTIPTLQHHKEMAESTCKSLKDKEKSAKK